jgi:sterol 3beta-glucosyltransferase
LDMRKPSPNIFLTTGFIAHGWLFRQAACVVHHGAAGTTAAALRAGVPSVIVPHALDQPLWAELMRGCGAAQAVIPFKQLNAERLAAAIDDVLSFKGDGRLSRLTEQVRLENGVDRAITLMEAEWGQTL